MPHAVRIPAIWHRIGKPPANSKLALRLPKQQQPSIGGLIAAFKSDCEFLASDRWQVEGKRCSVDHGGRGVASIHNAIRLNTDLLRESLVLRHSRQPNFHASCIIRAKPRRRMSVAFVNRLAPRKDARLAPRKDGGLWLAVTLCR